MAEFCLQCWNRLHGREDTKWDVRLSKEPELCEGCGRLCQTVVDINRERRFLKWLRADRISGINMMCMRLHKQENDRLVSRSFCVICQKSMVPFSTFRS